MAKKKPTKKKPTEAQIIAKEKKRIKEIHDLAHGILPGHTPPKVQKPPKKD